VRHPCRRSDATSKPSRAVTASSTEPRLRQSERHPVERKIATDGDAVDRVTSRLGGRDRARIAAGQPP
jgi:hypothetical protein